MLKEKSQEKEFEWRGLQLELKDVGKGSKELHARTGGFGGSIRLVPVKTGIDVIEDFPITKSEKVFRSDERREITFGFLATTMHCDFDGKVKSVDFVFLRDEKDEHPIKASVDFEKERNSQFSKLPGAMRQLLREYGILREYGGGVEMKWQTETSLSDADRRIDYFEESDPQHPYKLYHAQTVSFSLGQYSETPELSVTEKIQPGGKYYGDIHSIELCKSYSAGGFSGIHIGIMFQDEEGKPKEMRPFFGGYAYVSDEKEIRRIINHPKATEFKEIVERNRELMKVKPTGIAQS